uniref:Uncharacterized protein n=1 Tax=Siphoviridae sp. cthrG7 TaxID=2826428 RepID=A0A8S5MD66_9CAUD|nr:MAG TPA: hypothetical protein [Siphoviridae sp. cthrG7]
MKAFFSIIFFTLKIITYICVYIRLILRQKYY